MAPIDYIPFLQYLSATVVLCFIIFCSFFLACITFNKILSFVFFLIKSKIKSKKQDKSEVKSDG